ncbi:MAG: flagellar basal body L-ring protein FlgH [Tepidimonas sp.]|uniref:flagellar basal body L-ring protein FlgH n=1 Tax=Tepidimonas sp. TaxID=2002775 RepID=UPI0040551306
MMTRLSCALVLSVGMLGGCASLSQVPNVDLAKPPEEGIRYARPSIDPAQPPSGSLYAAQVFRPGFEDHRARLPGDVVTIQITESLSASQTAKTDVKRDSGLSAGVSAFPFLGASTLAELNAGAKSSNTFKGDGSTQAANTFRGSITAVVTEVLPNGHLVVIGEKQIGVNQAVDVLQFSGTVDPRAIQPGNVVPSTQVANVRVLSRGRGAPADAQTFGWLSRFFLTLLPF